jgi:peptidoglycan/xylan/chitin deacetylase (PgdA/CDA1 family)
MWRLPQGSAAALTFDDGPHAEYTPRVLDLLAAHRVQATFFVVGQAVQKHPQLLRRIVAEGHVIGSHTFTHRDLPTLNRDQQHEELVSCRELIKALTGADVTLIRPPRGRLDAVTLMRIKRWGYRLIHWSKTYSDYRQDGRGPLLQRIRARGLRPRDIALFHDNNAFTVEALAEVLPEWIENGRSFAVLR